MAVWSPEMLMLSGAIPLAAGVILLKMGVWPRRRGDSPHCRKCDYCLTGIATDRCPECGAALAAAAVAYGERRKRPLLTVVGLLCVMLAVVWSVGQGMQVEWYRHAPTFILSRNILSSDPVLSKRICAEMLRREERLSEGQRRQLIELALLQQTAATPAPAQPYLVEFLARCWARGHLSPEQKERFFTQIATIELQLPAKVKLGEELQYQLKYELRGPSRFSQQYMRIEVKHGEIRIDDESVFKKTGWTTAFNDASSRGTSGAGRGIVQTKLGRHHFVMNATVRVFPTNGPRNLATPCYERESRLEGTFDVDSGADQVASRPGLGGLTRVRITKVPGPGTGGSVLDVGEMGAFDALWVTCPCVLFEAGRYHMWYSSYYDSKMGAGGIGMAESEDGVHWKRLNDGRPVLTAGEGDALDNGQILSPVVQRDGQSYRMWYTGMSKAWHSSGFGYYRIFLATSENGLHWRRANGGKPVLDVGAAGSHDEVQAATPAILKEGDDYLMWYAAWSPRYNHTICRARSRDGVVWSRENGGAPVEGLSPSVAYGPAICRLGDEYLLLYMGSGARTDLYGAVSRDGNHWRMLADGAPILAPGPPGAFDASIIGHACFLAAGDRLRVWYTGYRQDPRGVLKLMLRIGLAELTLPG